MLSDLKSPFTGKRLFFILVFLFTNCLNSFAQSGWFWQNPLPQGNDLRDVWVLNHNTIFAVGDKGTLLKSTNAGESWEVTHKLNGISEDIINIQFINEQKGWLLANKYRADDYGNLLESCSELLLTVDGGTHWNIIASFDSLRLNDFCFINENDGWLVGYSQQNPYTVNGMVFKTSNGGSNWNLLFERLTPDQDQCEDRIPYSSIQFIDEYTGWISGKVYISSGTPDGDLLKTTDGGLGWNVIYDSLAWVKDFQFLNSSEGWIIQIFSRWFSGYSIEKTTDGGNTWQSVFVAGSLYGHVPTPSLYFINNSLGWILENGLFHKSTDGGINWVTDSINCPQNSAMHFSDEMNGCIVGRFGQILTTPDGGEYWIPRSDLQIDDQITSVSFYNENIGWTVANEFIPTFEGGEIDGKIFKTSDGGSSWIEQLFVPGGYGSKGFTDVQAVTDQIVYAAKTSIYKTTNGGNSWSQLTNIGDTHFNTLFFVDEDKGFVGNPEDPYSPGKIYKTIDGGNSWNSVLSAPHSIQSIFFVNDSEGWAVGYDNPIYKTTDGGDTWQEIATTNLQLESVYFTDSNNGWAVGRNQVGTIGEGIIIKSTDGGYNWDILYSSQEHSRFVSVFFNNCSIGYVVGYGGAILATTDGGANWYPQFDNTNKGLTDIFFINDETGWVVGEDGIILKTTTGGMTYVKEEKTSNAVTDFFLSQNFPNPFNPSTKIEFQIPKTGFVTLKIYNLLGEEVCTLLSGQLLSGFHSYEFDASGLASGVYVYQLRAGSFVETRKMILLR